VIVLESSLFTQTSGSCAELLSAHFQPKPTNHPEGQALRVTGSPEPSRSREPFIDVKTFIVASKMMVQESP